VQLRHYITPFLKKSLPLGLVRNKIALGVTDALSTILRLLGEELEEAS